ncbi:MAG TPA: DUF3108 domain-containing protein [Vicinamibacterales bacterium]|jgi:hypothetical protein
MSDGRAGTAAPATETATPPDAAGWTWREASGVTLIAVVAAVIGTWPLVAHPFSRLMAPVGPGDPYLNLWILGWDLRTLTETPVAWLTGRVFDANIFFPAERTLAYSDHLLLQSLAVWPLYAITRNLTVCYNALLFGSVAGCVLAMYAFVRAVTGSRAGALVAGVAWGLMPFHFAHLLHLQLQALYFLPLAFLFLHRVMAGRRRRDAAWLGVMAALSAVSSVYWGVIGTVALVLGAATLAVGVGRWRSAVIARRLLQAFAVGALLIAPVMWPYWQVQRREGFTRNLYEASQHEAKPISYLRVPPGNLLYGRTGWLRPPAASPANPAKHEGPEQELFPGFVLLALAGYGAWKGWRSDARPFVLTMGAVALGGFVLSLGPDGVRVLYAACHRFIFGFQAVRAPARFGVLVGFGLAGLAALGVREWGGRRSSGERTSWPYPLAFVLLVGLEFINVPLPSVPAPPRSTPAGAWLRAAPQPGAVLYLPLSSDLENTPAMVASLEHGRPIANGYSGQRPAFFMGLVDTLNRLPAADALWTLRDLNVRFVVASEALATGLAPGPLVERARFDDAIIYEVVWTPALEAAIPRPELPPPPVPGALPFAVSERSVYRIVWLTGGSMSVAAGTATFTADVSTHHFAVDVETAPWVARFFEARDRFESWTDDQLLPLRQEQHLREGRRVIDRTTRFDHVSRTVTTGDGPSLPLPSGGRDGLTAFFFARTLPMVPGYRTRFPVTEGGRSYLVDLDVQQIEAVSVNGKPVEAFRVVPRFESAGNARQRGIQATLWLSRDAQRIPLRFDIEAPFGAFRIELERRDAR